MGSEVEEVNRDISHNTVRTQLGRISVPGRNLQQWKRFLTVEKCHEIYLVFCYINQEQLPCTSMMAVLTNYQLLNILNSTNFTQITAFLVFWLPLPHFIFVRYAHTEVPVLSLLLPGA